MSSNANRIRPLILYDILSTQSDEKTKLSTEDLLNRLKTKGIECERRALQNDLNAMIAEGYPVKMTRNASKMYYVDDRRFTNGEINMLMDAVQSMTFIDDNYTRDLIEKIATIGGGGEQRMREHTDCVLEYTVVKTQNTEVLRSVEKIEQAIIEQKKLTFNYCKLDNKFNLQLNMKEGAPRKYIVTPLKKTIKNGFYYLLAQTGNYTNISIYRIDRMVNVELLNQHTVSDIDPADLEKFKKHLFEMYGNAADIIKIKIRIDSSFIKTIYDVFGNTEELIAEDDGNHYTIECEVINSPMFIAWCCSYGDKVQILKPQSLVNELKEYIANLAAMYQRDE